MKKDQEGVVDVIKDLSPIYMRDKITCKTLIEDLDIQQIDLNCALAGGIGVIITEKDFCNFHTVGDVVDFCLNR